MNKLKRRFAHYCLKVNKSYKEFLWRLADKDIPEGWHRATTYNKRISAARKKARLQKLHVSDWSSDVCSSDLFGSKFFK